MTEMLPAMLRALANAEIDDHSLAGEAADEIDRLRDENRKLRSMCKAAAAEIEEHWASHCDAEGYGPSSLVSRLKGELKPCLYPAYDEESINARRLAEQS